MQKKVSIGVLLPSSTITPMGRDFETGIKKGLQELLKREDREIELIPEFIGQGSKEKVETAINKLIGYDNADIITGIVSNKTGAEVAQKFEKGNRVFLINNLGEHLPNPPSYNANILLNSINLWQQVWSLGYWGAKKFGTTGMFVSGLYDAGYCFSSMMQTGMLAADSNSKMPFAVAPVAAPGTLSDVKSVFQHIETFNPDFIFAAFCGEEARLFLAEFISRGLHKQKPLLGLPFLLQGIHSAETFSVYTPISSSLALSDDKLSQMGEMAGNPFPLLGLETGLLIAKALENEESNRALQERFINASVVSERGVLEIGTNRPGTNNKIYLVNNTCGGPQSTLTRELVGELETVQIDNQEIKKILSGFSSGWFNPYLGV